VAGGASNSAGSEAKRGEVVEDPTYPIYQVEVFWEMDVDEGSKDLPPSWTAELPVGRVRNHTGFLRMLRSPDEDLVRRETNEWWPGYDKKGNNPSDPKIEVKFVRNESWCGGWFSHWTFDVGGSDEEVLASFERFVRRMEDLNRHEGHFEPHKDGSGSSYWVDRYCLMGAEDRRRWRSYPNGKNILGFDLHNSPGPAPCRCDGCKKNGIITIDH